MLLLFALVFRASGRAVGLVPGLGREPRLESLPAILCYNENEKHTITIKK